MIVYIVRHAPAEERDSARWPDDSQRPLTKKGERKFARAAAGLARVAKPPEVVLASPYTRAWRTAELLAEHADWPAPSECAALAAGRDPADALDVLASLGDCSVALVGHETQVSELLSLLLSGDEALVQAPIKKGAVARVTVAVPPVPASGQLDWFINPGTLRRVGR